MFNEKSGGLSSIMDKGKPGMSAPKGGSFNSSFGVAGGTGSSGGLGGLGGGADSGMGGLGGLGGIGDKGMGADKGMGGLGGLSGGGSSALQGALASAGYPNVAPDKLEQIKQILGEPGGGSSPAPLGGDNELPPL